MAYGCLNTMGRWTHIQVCLCLVLLIGLFRWSCWKLCIWGLSTDILGKTCIMLHSHIHMKNPRMSCNCKEWKKGVRSVVPQTSPLWAENRGNTSRAIDDGYQLHLVEMEFLCSLESSSSANWRHYQHHKLNSLFIIIGRIRKPDILNRLQTLINTT